MHAARSNSSNPLSSINAPSLWRLIGGFIVWASAFITLYVGHALACLYVPGVISTGGVRTILLACWIFHLLVSAWLVVRSARNCSHDRLKNSPGHPAFMWRAALLIDVSAWGAIFFTGLPVLAFDVCAP